MSLGRKGLTYAYGAQPDSYENTKFEYGIESFNEETVSNMYAIQHTNV
jgi:hypothetical protein